MYFVCLFICSSLSLKSAPFQGHVLWGSALPWWAEGVSLVKVPDFSDLQLGSGVPSWGMYFPRHSVFCSGDCLHCVSFCGHTHNAQASFSQLRTLESALVLNVRTVLFILYGVIALEKNCNVFKNSSFILGGKIPSKQLIFSCVFQLVILEP